MLEAGTKAPEIVLKDENGIIEKVWNKAKPDTNADEVLECVLNA